MKSNDLTTDQAHAIHDRLRTTVAEVIGRPGAACYNAGMINAPDFDHEAHVARYRDVVEQLEQQSDDSGRAEFRAIAKQLRAHWKEWQGEDSLHEMAFGEPENN